ncbi:MAG: DUF853 family protein, partial [Actinobacteria bacterium]|nr:DUF853 family protein [Actinomycetota bacterium]
MAVASRIGSGSPEPWYRIHALSADTPGGTAAADYAAVLPAALHAARWRRRFIVGWLSRGGSAPLELITNAGPLPARHGGPLPVGHAGPPDGSAGTVTGTVDMLFPWGARGTVISDDVLALLTELVWSPCPGRRVAVAVAAGDKAAQPSWPADDRTPPTLFESALQALVGRAFGWLVVAEPTDRLQAETAQLRNELTVLRRYDDEQSRFEASRAEQRLAELDTFGEAGLWDVRVLVGAANEQELELIVPLLVGSAELGAHPYRLRCPAHAPCAGSAGSALRFANALGAQLTERADGSAVPFSATAGALAALTGLPRHEVPGVRLIRAGYFDVTADERRPGPGVDLGSILDGRDRAVGSFSVPLATINRHALVTGATGSGKSQTVRHLLEQLTLAGIGWLAVEPVKSE